jgi:L-lactate dehydrogenase complex protein LldG
MPDDRALIMSRIRTALSTLQAREPRPDFCDDATLVSPPDGGGTIDQFAERLAGIGGRAFTSPAALAQWLTERGLRRGYCDRNLLAELGAAFAQPFVIDTRLQVDQIDEYEFGITRAAGAIVDTGTVILNETLTSRRLAALAPWVHVAVVRSQDFVPTIADAIRALGTEPYVVWCSGPSKTADVEGILIQGVHGPGEQVVLIT